MGGPAGDKGKNPPLSVPIKKNFNEVSGWRELIKDRKEGKKNTPTRTKGSGENSRCFDTPSLKRKLFPGKKVKRLAEKG